MEDFLHNQLIDLRNIKDRDENYYNYLDKFHDNLKLNLYLWMFIRT